VSLPPRQWPEAALTLLRTFGIRGALLRARHELRLRGNRFRAEPRHRPDADEVPVRSPFRVDGASLAAVTMKDAAVDRADRVVAGFHQAYRWEWRPLPADAAGWLVHPFTGRSRDAFRPWWKTPHLDPDFGDIKDLWEPARFAWVYDLVRGWLVTGDDRYVRAFQEHLSRWYNANPAFRGPHWSCGQETAIRAAALLYAEVNLAGAPCWTQETRARIAEVLAASGERIADAIGYAVSQRNNHAISEAAGLVMLGVRFQGRHPEAGRWLASGRRWLELLVREQFAPDGWYIQHSFTYQRLALDQLVLAERALRAVGQRLSPDAVRRIRAAADLLFAVIDPATGEVPNHGANDGAFVHPVTLAEYRDFRPVLTAVCGTWGIPLPADVPADAEALAWLGLSYPPGGPAMVDGVRTGPSGWAAARVGDTRVFLRAGRYRSRPGHLDPLHLDVRVGGRELVVDPGTFSYNAPPPWRNGLATARVHNGPLVDGAEPGVRGPRFLWYIWPASDLVHTNWDGTSAAMVAEVPGRVRRSVRVTDGSVEVRDEALGGDTGDLSVLWTLHPEADPGAVRVEGESRAVETEAGGVRGWYSPHYARRIPTRCLEVVRPAGTRGPVVTRISVQRE